MEICKNYYETLYSRPVLELSGYAAKYQLSATLLAYLGFGGGITGSFKDALAEGMLALATEKKLLAPGQTVVEVSSGSFAVALAIACAHSHHPLVLCMPASVPEERQQALASFGAKIVLSNPVYGRRGVEKRAQETVEQAGGYFINYFDNDLNAEFHRRVTGPAIVKATGGEVDAIVIGVGTAGTITGVGEYAKAWIPDVRIVAVEPYESQSIGGGPVGRHGIPGLGAGFVPENYNPYIVDTVMAVSSGQAAETAQELMRSDAVPACISGGAVVAASRQLLEQDPYLKHVLCIIPGQIMCE